MLSKLSLLQGTASGIKNICVESICAEKLKTKFAIKLQ